MNRRGVGVAHEHESRGQGAAGAHGTDQQLTQVQGGWIQEGRGRLSELGLERCTRVCQTKRRSAVEEGGKSKEKVCRLRKRKRGSPGWRVDGACTV